MSVAFDHSNGAAYAKTALDAECAALAGTQQGRNDQLNRSAFSIGTLVGAGLVDRGEAEQRLYGAAEANGYVGKDGAAAARATIGSGLDRGTQQPRDVPAHLRNDASNGSAAPRPKPAPALSGVPIPDWTPPDHEKRPKFLWAGKAEPHRFDDEVRRHLYRRDGEVVRVKVKKTKDAFVDWYKVRRPTDGAIGWQSKKPAGWVPVPYAPPGAPNPFEAERRGETLVWSEGEKDADALHERGFLSFTFGGTSDVPDCAGLLGGHHVVVVVDNDEAGRQSIARKVKAAQGAGAASIRVVQFPELPEGGDVSDFFDGGGDAEGFLDRAKPIESDAPREEPDGGSEPKTGAKSKPAPSILFYGDQVPEPAPWLIRDVLPQQQVAILAGQHSAGKTFIGIDLSYSVMTGEPFISHNVERAGAVLWLAAEGASELTIRLKAAAVHRAGDDCVGLLPFAYQAFEVPTLTETDALPKLMALVAETKAGLNERFPGTELVMIVVDTLNSAAGFQDENSASEAQRVFNVLRKLSDASGALVLVVDHYGKMTETGVRGSSAKSGAADAILAALADKDDVTGKIDNRRMAVTKLRGAPTGEIVPFTLKPVPVDAWGNTHCGIAWGEPADGPGGKPAPKAAWSGKSRILKACIERAMIEHGSLQQPHGMNGPKVKAVPVEKVRPEFYASYPADDREAKKKAFRRMLDAAIGDGLLGNHEIGASLQDWIWFVKEDPP